MVKPVVLHEIKCWAVKNQHNKKVSVAEMRMLRWICGKTRDDRIRNENVIVWVTPIVKKLWKIDLGGLSL